MAWSIKLTEAAEKQLAKLDNQVGRRIYAFLEKRVAVLDDPRSIGEALTGTRLGEFGEIQAGGLQDHRPHRG